ncbi:GGDEF domain-containing protein [Maridesulfovibrio frigidus]|uniref:GGDEF domain-containing protein n=1 Tax=Maridesulfovibrio frigidus TaxID=340956 RepID=UPI0006917BD6|nr:GGDEF domain-containing protein [Maridesulfovibrio frigidus]
MDINISATLIDNGLISLTLGLIMMLFAYFHKIYNGFVLISSAYICLSTAFALSAARPYFPELSIIAAHTLGSTTLFLIYIGTERFRAQEHRLLKFSLLIPCTSFLSASFFTSIIPNIKACDTIFSVLIFIQLVLCIWATLRNTIVFKSYQFMLSTALALVIASFTYKTYTTFKHPIAPNSFQTAWPYWSHMLAYHVTLILSSFAFIWGSVERAEIEKNKHAAKLEANYHFMDVLLDAIPIPVFHKDKDLRYRNINQAFCGVIGLSKEDIIGKTTMEIIPNKIVDLSKAFDLRVLATGKEQEYETAFPFPDSLQHEVQVKKSAFIDSSGDISGIVGAFTDITERKIYEAKIKHLALHDQVTGLPNRNMFYAQLKRSIAMAKRNNYTLALLYIDLDGFKTVNDTYGHDAGDTLLRSIGKRLMTTVRESDTACRIGGDEFTVLTEMYNNPSDIEIVAEKIRKALAQPASCEGNVCQTSASIGVALYPQDAETSRDLVKAADKAMYLAKNKGKNQVYFYKPLKT